MLAASRIRSVRSRPTLANRHAETAGERRESTRLTVPRCDPPHCPCQLRRLAPNGVVHASAGFIRMQRFFSPTTTPATDWRTPLCSPEPASTSLATRALQMRDPHGARAIGPSAGNGSLSRCSLRLCCRRVRGSWRTLLTIPDGWREGQSKMVAPRDTLPTSPDCYLNGARATKVRSTA